ncbi:MAG: ABC transporter ATP-binding protein [bacterium]
MNLYSLENLSFSYAGRRILDIQSLIFNEGRIYSITGPNGSGKTTLLMLLGMLKVPDEGRIFFRGQDPYSTKGMDPAAVRKEVGFLLQAPYLFSATVEKNIGYGLAVRKTPGDVIARKVDEALHLVGMQGTGKRQNHTLSGGEVQRVALARALVTEPAVLLLDEPLANVDPASRSVIEGILLNKCRDEGMSIIITTHDIEQAYRLSDEVVTLMDGRVTPGAMENIFHGAVYQSGGSWVFDTGRISIFVPGGNEGTRTAFIPPESILLSSTAVYTSARNTLRGRITKVQERNGSVEVTVNAGETLTSRITRESFQKMGLNLGSEVSLIFKTESVKIY